ncbi:MAG: hypothetical protein AAF591_20845 [Verrucomicrobiota bacterium]
MRDTIRRVLLIPWWLRGPGYLVVLVVLGFFLQGTVSWLEKGLLLGELEERLPAGDEMMGEDVLLWRGVGGWMPLEGGNWWRFSGRLQEDEVRVTGPYPVEGAMLYELTGLPGGLPGSWFLEQTREGVRVVGYGEGEHLTLFHRPLLLVPAREQRALGKVIPSEVEDGPLTGYVRRVEGIERVTTRFGRMECQLVSFESNFWTYRVWFGRDVGIVKIEAEAPEYFGGYIAYSLELAEFRVGGRGSGDLTQE